MYGRGESSYRGRNSGSGSYAGANLRPVDWNQAQNKPLKKNIYNENPVVTCRSKHDVDNWIQKNDVTLNGSAVPRPVFEFNEVGYPQKIVDLLYKNYQQPTVIQSVSWPVALSGRDMISIAKTGSGKTLGFLLPAIMHTLSLPRRQRGEGPSVLVMLPTRELALQVQDVVKEYCAVMGLSFACLYGGASKRPQANALHSGIDVCIATPGRLLDFLDNGTVTMSRCSFLVLDEADRMLDMGFEPQIRKIVSQIRPDRQTLMFSATWPKEVRNLARDFQQDPVHLNVGSMELAANHNIKQIVEVVDERDKRNRLYDLLEKLSEEKDPKVIVFVATKRAADDLTRTMRANGWPALCVHGDKEQREREWVLNEFRSGQIPILLATDVFARGIDIDDIKAVINMDCPNNCEDYVHRIGRTGRQGKSGVAYTFLTSKDAPKARDLIKIMQEAKQDVPNDLRDLSMSAVGKGKNRGRGFKRSANSNHEGIGSAGNAKRGRFTRW